MHKIFLSDLSVEDFRSQLLRLVVVENDKPMLKFLGWPFFRVKGINSERQLFGAVDQHEFKIWENDTNWNGWIVSYAHGLYAAEGAGTRLILRVRRSTPQQVLLALSVLGATAATVTLFGDISSSRLSSWILILGAVVAYYLLFTLPFVLIHRSMVRKLEGFLTKELRLRLEPRP